MKRINPKSPVFLLIVFLLCATIPVIVLFHPSTVQSYAQKSWVSPRSASSATAPGGEVKAYYEPQRRPGVHILALADEKMREATRNQSDHMECYAKRHGYVYKQLEFTPDSPCAVLENIRFIKHCVCSFYMEQQPPGDYAVVIDNDVAPGAPNMSLARWIDYMRFNDVDMAFIDRAAYIEITSGTYMYRNSPLALGMVRYFTSFDKVRPPGFSNVDQSPVYLGMLDLLAYKGREECHRQYFNMTEPMGVEPPIYNFVACVGRLLGPAGLHQVMDGDVRKGAIAVFPRFFSFVLDAHIFQWYKFRNFHPFFHGVKDRTWERYYMKPGTHDTAVKCHDYTDNEYISDKDMAAHIRKAEEGILKPKKDMQVIPRWAAGWSDPTCYDRLWCPPTPFELEWPPAYVENNALVHIRKPERDSVNALVRRIESGSDMLQLIPDRVKS